MAWISKRCRGTCPHSYFLQGAKYITFANYFLIVTSICFKALIHGFATIRTRSWCICVLAWVWNLAFRIYMVEVSFTPTNVVGQSMHAALHPIPANTCYWSSFPNLLIMQISFGKQMFEKNLKHDPNMSFRLAQKSFVFIMYRYG